MPRKVTLGGGITAREIEVCSPNDPEAGAFFAKSRKSFKAAIAETGSLFGAVSNNARKTCEQMIPPFPLPKDFELEGEDTPEQFAVAISKHIASARKAISDRRADAAAVDAWRAGVLWARANMKWEWEEDALLGQEERSRRQRGGGSNAKWAKLAEPYRQRSPEKSRSAIVREMLVDYPDADESTVKRALKRLF
jgi:hypothetical protein